jgi:hypothetical protein
VMPWGNDVKFWPSISVGAFFLVFLIIHTQKKTLPPSRVKAHQRGERAPEADHGAAHHDVWDGPE